IVAFYEGIRIGKAEVRGITTSGAGDVIARVAAVRLTGFEDGRIAEWAVEGVDATGPQGAIKLGRFALNGFSIAGVMRMAVQATTMPPANPTDQAFGFLRVLEGFSLKDLDVPDKSGHRITVQRFDGEWGKFVGPIPTSIHSALNMTGSIDKTDRNLAALAA